MLPMMKNVLEGAASLQLSDKETGDIEQFVSDIVTRHPHVDAGNLARTVTNSNRFYKMVAEANSGIYTTDVDIYRDISQIITAKFFVGSVLNELASVQPLNNCFGYIFRLTMEYGDTAAGATAGQALSAVRTSAYAADPGEDVIPRRLKAELRSTLVEAVLRPLDLSHTFQSMLRISSVYGKGNMGVFNNQLLTAAYNKLRDELEVSTIAAIDAAIPAANVVSFTEPVLVTPCTEQECAYSLIHESIQEAARRVFDSTGYHPNVLITGPEGLTIMEKNIKIPNNTMFDQTGMIPQRGRVGIYAKRYMVYYDPSLTAKIICGVFEPQNPMNNPIVYAPYITMGVTPEIRERDMSVSNVAFAVDRVDITEPAFFGRVDIV